jgi:profilin
MHPIDQARRAQDRRQGISPPIVATAINHVRKLIFVLLPLSLISEQASQESIPLFLHSAPIKANQGAYQEAHQMSSTWQPYVDDNLVGSGKLHAALIASNADGVVWAASAGLRDVDARELNVLVDSFADSALVRSEGLRLRGDKYIVLKSGDGRSLYAKRGDQGLVAVRTKQCLLVGLYAAPVVPGEAAKVVESLADYLLSVDF